MSTEAYIYAQRPLAADSKVKIGAHTGSKEKLFSRYKTYHGSEQELKIARVEANVLLSFEKFVHQKLKRDGLHIEYELFEPKAWGKFDEYAKLCISPEFTIEACISAEKEPKKKEQIRVIKRDVDYMQLQNLERDMAQKHMKKKVRAMEERIARLETIDQLNENLKIFLGDPENVRFEKGAETPLIELKKAFEAWLGVPVHKKLNVTILSELHHQWRIIKKMMCKNCGKAHNSREKCCTKSNFRERTTSPSVVLNLVLN